MAKDDRVTMKVDRALWEKVQQLVSEHPEWGVLSVPEFIRRAIDAEIRFRIESDSSRVINLQLLPGSSENSGQRRR